MSHNSPSDTRSPDGRQQANVLDVVDRRAEAVLITRHQIEALFANQDLADRIAADRGLHRVLNVGRVDAVAVGLGAIDLDVDVGLAQHAKQAQIGDARNGLHDVHDLLAGLLQIFQVRAEDLYRQFAFHAADRLFHVVGDRL